MPRFRSDDDDAYRQAMRDAIDPFDETAQSDDEDDADDYDEDADEDDDENQELPF